MTPATEQAVRAALDALARSQGRHAREECPCREGHNPATWREFPRDVPQSGIVTNIGGTRVGVCGRCHRDCFGTHCARCIDPAVPLPTEVAVAVEAAVAQILLCGHPAQAARCADDPPHEGSTWTCAWCAEVAQLRAQAAAEAALLARAQPVIAAARKLFQSAEHGQGCWGGSGTASCDCGLSDLRAALATYDGGPK